MQTIELQIPDNIYNQLVKSGIDIKQQLQDNLYDLLDDGYSSITTQEATKRVSDLVRDYESGAMKTVPYEQGMDKIDNWLKTI